MTVQSVEMKYQYLDPLPFLVALFIVDLLPCNLDKLQDLVCLWILDNAVLPQELIILHLDHSINVIM